MHVLWGRPEIHNFNFMFFKLIVLPFFVSYFNNNDLGLGGWEILRIVIFRNVPQ
jgi:hypothetical protein